MQNPLLYFCRHFSPVNRYHKFHSIFSIRHVRIKSVLFRLHLKKETDINSFFCKRNFIIRKFRPIKRISHFLRTINYLVNCSLVNQTRSNSFVLLKEENSRISFSIIFSDIISQKYYSLSRIIVEKIRKEPPRICRMRGPRFMKPRVQSATVFTVTKGRACKLNTIPWTGTLFLRWAHLPSPHSSMDNKISKSKCSFFLNLLVQPISPISFR